jgi:predicted phage-related endonuclease
VLTEAQREIRATGIGASESSEVLDNNPFPCKGPLDLWMRKPNPHRPAMVPAFVEPENDIGPGVVGSYLEDGLRALFERKTGLRLARRGPVTLRHEDLPCVLASPDDEIPDIDEGLELKVVGMHVAHHWAHGLPDYVRAQCVQNIAVTGRKGWRVLALVNGTEVQIHRVVRDLDTEDLMLEAVHEFWGKYVLRNQPPPVKDPEARRRYLMRRYPFGRAPDAVRKAHGDPDVARLMRELVTLKAQADAVEERKREAENALVDYVGDGYALAHEEGKFIWMAKSGRVNWQGVAEKMAGGLVPAEVVEQHRGAGWKEPRFYPKKERKT